MTPSLRAHATAVNSARHGWWGHTWDRLSMYLPLLLMGLLALLSYWVLRELPQLEQEPMAGQHPEGPDYVMRHFALRSYHPDGRMKSEIIGLEARHYPASGELHIQQAKLRTLDWQGRQTRAEAQRLETDDAQLLYQLEGRVLLVSEPAPGTNNRSTTFEGQQLRVDTVTGTIISTLPVKVMHGSDHLQADSLHYVDSERSAWFRGRVKATLVPRP